jgi:hypothetical protein
MNSKYKGNKTGNLPSTALGLVHPVTVNIHKHMSKETKCTKMSTFQQPI